MNKKKTKKISAAIFNTNPIDFNSKAAQITKALIHKYVNKNILFFDNIFLIFHPRH